MLDRLAALVQCPDGLLGGLMGGKAGPLVALLSLR